MEGFRFAVFAEFWPQCASMCHSNGFSAVTRSCYGKIKLFASKLDHEYEYALEVTNPRFQSIVPLIFLVLDRINIVP